MSVPQQQAPAGGAGGHRGPGDPAAGPPLPAAPGNPFAPSPASTPQRPTISRASTPIPRDTSEPRRPSTPTAAEVLGELRDVFNAMDANGDGDGDAWSEGDALSAEGPDEVVARDAAAANRWPDGGEAAHPVRRPPEHAALFRESVSPDARGLEVCGLRDGTYLNWFLPP